MHYNYIDELMSSPLSLYNESIIFHSNLTLNLDISYWSVPDKHKPYTAVLCWFQAG